MERKACIFPASGFPHTKHHTTCARARRYKEIKSGVLIEGEVLNNVYSALALVARVGERGALACVKNGSVMNSLPLSDAI